MRPQGLSSDRIQVSWKNFSGQHWRKPVSLVTAEEIVLKPWAEAIVSVKPAEGEGEDVMQKGGLITPMRSKHVVNCKFSTAYGYVDKG
jgi:hypothetical protein